MKVFDVKLKTIQEVLGTNPGDKEVYDSFIASKAPTAASIEEEIAAYGVDSVAEKGKTIFLKDEEGHPYIYSYMIRGFLKSAAGACKAATGSKTNKAKLTAHKKKIDLGVFIPNAQRRLYWCNPDGSLVSTDQIGDCQRPLRADTAQGPRVSLANSETIPAGSTLSFRLYVVDDNLEELVEEWLRYGCLNGLGQWRNSGKGSFIVEELSVEDREFGDFYPGDF